jgi:putative aldouronate transport system permease protein
MVESKGWGYRFGTFLIYVCLTFVALSMLLPFVYVFAVSFSSLEDVLRGGIILWPRNWSTAAYEFVLSNPMILRSLGNSIFLATVGTAVSLVFTASMAYALASKHLKFRRFFLILVLIPFLFWPGIIPRFLIVKETGLLNSIWALIIPSAIEVFNLIVMRNFFMDIPEELIESAELDGANDLQVLWHIVLPLSKPVLAAIGLFYAVSRWNLYFAAILYISDGAKWPIQVILRQLIIVGEGDYLGEVDVMMPAFTVQMATVIVATIPIIIVYPFLQRYFVKGVLTGAIKG